MSFDMLKRAAHTVTMLPEKVQLTRENVSEEVKQLAGALSRRHGHVTVTVEKNGAHLNMACPACLDAEGARELLPGKRHLAVNADKYLSQGKWFGKPPVDFVGKCMKCGKPYSVVKLLQWAPLSARGYNTEAKVTVTDNSKWLVSRGGIDVPGGPGYDSDRAGVTPLTQLPADHPAVVYLQQRGYDLASLEDQFEAGYCWSEWPEDRAAERYHKRLIGGMKDSHQGRIIFFSRQDGVQRGYQGRIIEHTWQHEAYTVRSFWCGQSNTWKTMDLLSDGEWILLPEWRDAKGAWPPSKYKNASGCERNSMLFGLDAAVRYNATHRPGKVPYAIVVEGPLDAGRFGAPAVARIGKFLSDAQIKILAARFGVLFLVPDNDRAGLESVEDDRQRACVHTRCEIARLPELCPRRGIKLKDPGEMEQTHADAFKAELEARI